MNNSYIRHNYISFVQLEGHVLPVRVPKNCVSKKASLDKVHLIQSDVLDNACIRKSSLKILGPDNILNIIMDSISSIRTLYPETYNELKGSIASVTNQPVDRRYIIPSVFNFSYLRKLLENFYTMILEHTSLRKVILHKYKKAYKCKIELKTIGDMINKMIHKLNQSQYIIYTRHEATLELEDSFMLNPNKALCYHTGWDSTLSDKYLKGDYPNNNKEIVVDKNNDKSVKDKEEIHKIDPKDCILLPQELTYEKMTGSRNMLVSNTSFNSIILSEKSRFNVSANELSKVVNVLVPEAFNAYIDSTGLLSISLEFEFNDIGDLSVDKLTKAQNLLKDMVHNIEEFLVESQDKNCKIQNMLMDIM